MTTTTDSDHDFGQFAPSDYSISPHYGYFVSFSGLWVDDPENPKTRHAITHDTIVEADGSVRVRVNGVELDELGERPGSYVR